MVKKRLPVSFLLGQVIIYGLLVFIVEFILFLIGNFQNFQDVTQELLFILMDKTLLILMFSSILTILIMILEAFLYKGFPLFFFILMILTLPLVAGIQFFLKFLSGFLRL